MRYNALHRSIANKFVGQPLTLERPDKLRAMRTGGFANVEMVFDGKTLSLLGKNANLYAQVDAPGTIDQLVDMLRDNTTGPSQPPIC